MINLTQDIQSLTDFKRHALKFIERLKQTGEPLVLTVKGRAEVVVQDARSYQDLLERAALSEEVAAIRKSIEEFERGEGRPAREALRTDQKTVDAGQSGAAVKFGSR